jgi:membrane protein YdbS with pleckstrin-like domain
MSSWKLSAFLVCLLAAMVATISLGATNDLSTHGWWSLLAFLAIAFAVIGVLTVLLVPRRSKTRRS